MGTNSVIISVISYLKQLVMLYPDNLSSLPINSRADTIEGVGTFIV